MTKALAIVLAALAQAEELPRYEMPEVVVTATRLSLPADASPWPVEVLEAGEAQVTDLADLLSQGVSADVRSYGYEGHSAFPILGGILASRVLVLANGVHMNSRRDGVIDLSLIPIAAGDRVEVVKGPLSALYGSAAIGGVVNVIPSRKDRLAARFGTTDQLGVNTGVCATHNFGIFGARASGSYLANPGFRRNDDVSRYNGQGTLWIDPADAFHIEGCVGFTHRYLGVPGPQPDTTDTAFAAPPFGDSLVTSLYDNQTDNLLTAGFKTSYTPFENFSLSLSLNTVQQDFIYNYKYFDGYFDEDFNWVSWTSEDSSIYNDRKVSAELVLSGTLFEKVTLAGGALALQERFGGHQLARDSAADTLTKDLSWEASDIQIGAWVEGLVEFGMITPSVAVRLDNSPQYGTFISPEAGVSVEAIPEMLNVSAAYGQAFRAPSFNDLYWPADPYGVGDSTLIPERGQTASLSAEVRPVAFLEFSLVGSWKDIRDMISWLPDPEDPTGLRWKPANLDQVTILGGEANAGWRFAEGLVSGSLGLAYNKATETTEVLDTVTYDEDFNITYETITVERQAAFIPPLTIKGNLAVRAWKGGKVSADASWTGRRVNYYTDYSPYPDIDVLEKTIGPSLKIDLAVSQRLFKLLSLEVGVKNVLNDQTPAHFGSYNDLNYPTAPRRFHAGLSIAY